MNYSGSELERRIKANFAVDIRIGQVIAGPLPVSHTGEGVVFLSNKKQLFVYIEAQANLQFGDVRKIVSRMGLKADHFLPPNGDADYFNGIGLKNFKKVFPGRSDALPSDLEYYRTLAPYNPALVQISEVMTGRINRFDVDAKNNWRPEVNFAYRRIRTS